jgi:hypothetical protein
MPRFALRSNNVGLANLNETTPGGFSVTSSPSPETRLGRATLKVIGILRAGVETTSHVFI